MVVKTQPAFAGSYTLRRDKMSAGAQRIQFADKLKNRTGGGGIGIWSVIFRPVELFLTGHEHPGIRLFGHHNHRIRFIIFQKHIISWLILLYHGVFKIERILLSGHDYIFHVSDSPHQEIGAGAVMSPVEI